MSTYFSVFDCQDCDHRVFIGFVGEMNQCPIFCTSCHARCLLCPPQGTRYLETSLPHEIFISGRKEETFTSKKGRMKKTKLVQAWVSTGITVPIEEGLRELGEKIDLTFTPRWESVRCPSCQQVGTLLDFRNYVRHCPRCGSEKMLESDL